MDDKRNSIVVSILLLLLLINLVVPVAYLVLMPTPAVAASTATYTENWEAQRCLVTRANLTWDYSRRADSTYVSVTPSNVGNPGGWGNGSAYAYTWSWSNDGWSISPHGLVTEWKVTGKLTQN
jgi:hypothetical protein